MHWLPVLIQLARSLDLEFHPKGIRVNSIGSQPIGTERKKIELPKEVNEEDGPASRELSDGKELRRHESIMNFG